MDAPFRVSFLADASRDLRLVIHWPGVGYWSFAASRWVPALDPATCYLALERDPDDPDAVGAWVPRTGATRDVELKLVAIGPDGRPHTLAVETIGAGS